jgi:hypothetical protein
MVSSIPRSTDPTENEDYLFRLCQEKNWDAVREYLSGGLDVASAVPAGSASASSSIGVIDDCNSNTGKIIAAAAATTTTTTTRSRSSTSVAKEEKLLLTASSVRLDHRQKDSSSSATSNSPSRKATQAQTAKEKMKRAIMHCPSSDEELSTSPSIKVQRLHSCLHEACDRGAPADVVRMMIDIAGTHLTKLKDSHGRTALLIACGRSGACYDVIKTLAESGGKELVLMKSDYDGGTALHWLCMCMDNHAVAAEEKITLLIRIGGEELLSMEEHLGQTAYHVAKSKPGVSQTILQLLQNPTQSIDRAKVTGTTTTSRLTEKLAQAKKTIERLTRKNKELREKIVALEAAANPQSLSEMEQKFDALLQNKISNLGAKVEILMENWMSNLESRLGILHVDDPDNLVSKCSRFEAL